MINWFDIRPEDAQALNLARDPDIMAPLNEMGERCPWPWEPQQLVGVPMGQYHCGYCGAMVLAGVPHLDYTGYDNDRGPSGDASDHMKVEKLALRDIFPLEAGS